MTDGAHLGIDAERALGTVLGGEPQPTAEEGMDVETMREWLLAASAEHASDGYGECARYAGKLILEYLLADPRRATIPTEAVYETGADGRMTWPAVVITPGLYDVMKGDGVDLGRLGLTGFQWGWAVNAARRCVEMPPVANPAIVEVTPNRP